MDHRERLRQALHGVAVTIVSIFDPASGEVDTAAMRANVGHILDGGVRLVIPCGNTGEYHSLTVAEWRLIVDTLIDVAGGRAAIMPAIGGALPDALAMGKHAQEQGADGVLILPLHHPHSSPAGMYRYYLTLLDTLEIGVVAYLRNGNTLPESTLLRLAKHTNMVAVKYAQTDVRQFANTLLKNESRQIVWSCGLAELWAPMFFVCGAIGFTSGLANFAPRGAVALYEALAAGHWARAMQIRSQMVPFEMLRARHNDANSVSAVKEAMALSGLRGGVVRPPLSELSPEDRAELENSVTLLRFLEQQLNREVSGAAEFSP